MYIHSLGAHIAKLKVFLKKSHILRIILKSNLEKCLMNMDCGGDVLILCSR